MTTVHVLCWKWGSLFGPEYVNRLRAGLARHLQLEHEVVCVTDDPAGIDPAVRILPLPETLRETPRCRRRMRQFDREFAAAVGPRILSIDLDMVIVDDITPLVQRPEPLVCWKVGHAGVFSGSFVLMDAGVLHGLWRRFAADPEGFPGRTQARGIASDQAMLNWFLARRPPIPYWRDEDGFVTFYGAGYEEFEHLGVGPSRQELPAGARVVVLGSDDKHLMDAGAYAWIRTHWSSLGAVPA